MIKLPKILIFFFKKSKKPNQIDQLKKAMSRVQNQIDNLHRGFDYKSHCCASCYCGGFDEILYRKLERQAMWLRVLLRRSNRENKLEEIKFLEFEFGKNCLDRLEKSGGKYIRG
jgi:hypothetical protein